MRNLLQTVHGSHLRPNYHHHLDQNRTCVEPPSSSHLIQAVYTGTKTAMERKNLVVHQGGDRQVVEHLGQTFPHPGVAELPLALVVEAVGLSCLPALIIFICPFV